ncbi:MAG: hypothetical protein HQM11_07910 [SAR324 cluster bacterium]|nr:hypothetical protein [SAR324 cluster bacterium]
MKGAMTEEQLEKLRVLYRDALRQGFGLMQCESPEEAQLCRDFINGKLPPNLYATIVRDREVNVYSMR